VYFRGYRKKSWSHEKHAGFRKKDVRASRSLQAGSLRSGGSQRSDGSLRSGDLIFEKSFL
jgi:hypothetical protein